jgi:SAM-dependent methyltransferase
MTETPQQCPLCLQSFTSAVFCVDKVRDFYRCPHCCLIFVPPLYFLSLEQEKAEYDQHQNSPDDPGYRSFLSKLFLPVQNRIAPNSKGLDFGSGPGPTLSVMFEEQGHTVSLYDPIYAADKSVLSGKYDFVCASEVVEHFHKPAKDLDLLWSLVKPGGWLGIMTGTAQDRKAFTTWRYKDDLSHVAFFSMETMEWLAGKWQAELHTAGKNVFLFTHSPWNNKRLFHGGKRIFYTVITLTQKS